MNIHITIDGFLNENISYTYKDIKKIGENITDNGKFVAYDILDDYPRDRSVMFTIHEDDNGYIVKNSFIPEGLRRLGIANDFYIFQNKLSIKNTGNPLQSTNDSYIKDGKKKYDLSDNAVMLWESLVKKGFAIRISDRKYRFIR